MHSRSSWTLSIRTRLRLAKYIKEHNGIDVDPRSIFDVQVKRLHEYKRQLMNILHVMYLYNQLKDNPNMAYRIREPSSSAQRQPPDIRAQS
ncbi:MAG: glycogen/starch/alpha-glucan phosphorylase [Pilosibacter sp.]